MAEESEPTTGGRIPRFRAWVLEDKKEQIERLQLQIGALAGGIVVSRDSVINILLGEALDARSKPKEEKKKSNAKRRTVVRSKKVRQNESTV